MKGTWKIMSKWQGSEISVHDQKVYPCVTKSWINVILNRSWENCIMKIYRTTSINLGIKRILPFM